MITIRLLEAIEEYGIDVADGALTYRRAHHEEGARATDGQGRDHHRPVGQKASPQPLLQWLPAPCDRWFQGRLIVLGRECDRRTEAAVRAKWNVVQERQD
jgi:hypothetical protein